MFPVAVLAGGLGTRLRSVTGETLPKALIPVGGRPFIEHKLVELRDEGALDVVLLTGHGGEALRRHVGSGDDLGVRVRYEEDGDTLLGTGGALLKAMPLLGSTFWVTYGDTLLDVDTAAAELHFARSDALGLMTVLHNRDEWEPSNVRVEGTKVAAYAKQPPPSGAEHIDYGMLLLRTEAFSGFTPDEVFDLARVIEPLVQGRRLDAFEVDEPFHDVGTPGALEATEAWLRTKPGRRA